MSLSTLAAVLLLWAPPAPAPITRTLLVTAADADGTPVGGLAASDVVVMENGVARNVTRLEHDTRPLTVAVLVDTSAPAASSYRLYVVPAVTSFLQTLPGGSRVAVWSTGDRPRKLVDFADDRAQVNRALPRVAPTGGNRIIDAVVEAAKELQAREGERTAVVVVSGLGIGFSDYERRRAVDEALPSGAVFHTITFDADRSPGEDAGGGDVRPQDYEYVLGELARKSGGRRQSLLTPMGVADALRKVASDLGGQYRLTYESAEGASDRKLEVTVARPGVKVRVGASR